MKPFYPTNGGAENAVGRYELLDAVGCLCMLAMSSDGTVADEEKQTLVDIIRNEEKFSEFSAETKTKVLARIASEVNDAAKFNSTDTLIAQKCKDISDLGESEFAVEKINRIIEADGKIAREERIFIKTIGNNLNVPTDDSEKDKGLFEAVISLCLIAVTLNGRETHDDELHAVLGIVKKDEKFKPLSEKYKSKVFGEAAQNVKKTLESGNTDSFVMEKCCTIRNLKEVSFAVAKIQQIIEADNRLSKKELKFIDSLNKYFDSLERKA